MAVNNMQYFTNIRIIGRLGADPEITYYDSGKCKCTFSLAVSSKFRDEKITTWHSCEAWGKTAEYLTEYATKGALISIEAILKKNSWKDKTTNATKSNEILVANAALICNQPKSGDNNA